MKKIIAILGALSAAVMLAQAQTNTPPSTNSASADPLGALRVGSDILSWLKDAQPYFGVSNTIVGDALALYNNKQWGGLIALHLPVAALSTNGQISAGTAIAYINHQFYTLSLNMQAGTTWKVPLLGNVYTAMGSGPELSLHDHSVGAFSFVSATKGWDVGSGHVLSLVGGVGNDSHLSGPCYFGGLSFSW